jgi:prolyl oligopeptidase
MYVVHRQDLVRDGRNPTLLAGYGGFNIPEQPAFSVLDIFAMRHLGFVLAFPALRGGRYTVVFSCC